MGYFKNLEEYSDSELVGELRRRLIWTRQGLCAYCHKPFEECRCKMKGQVNTLDSFNYLPRAATP